MKIEILQELKPYSFNELKDIFQKSKISIEEIIKNLSISNLVRQVNREISALELEKLLDIKEIEDLDPGKDMFVFKYVGMILVENVCLVIYPKYLSNFKDDKNREYTDLRQILSVIGKYKCREQKISGENTTISNFNLLSTAIELLADYYENGLYKNDLQIIENNGNGEILWEKTINETQVYFSNGFPFYLDYFSVAQVDDINDYFRRLHITVITDLSKRLNDIFKVLNIEGLYLTSEKIEDFGNIDYIRNRIDKELTIQYITKRQRILKLIKKYLLEKDSFYNKEKISLLGTSNFNLVWEDVCSVVFHNSLKTPLEELGLTFSGSKKKSTLLIDTIEKPIWKSYEYKTEYIANRTLIPDIVTVSDDCISIYDAKYYKILLNDEFVKNHPGVEDVAKQYLYEMALGKISSENNLSIKTNAFLMPTDLDIEQHLGNVRMDIFNDLNVKEIEIILIPTREVYKQYLNY